MTGTLQPSVYLCPECGSDDTYEEATSDVFFCKACDFQAPIEDVMDAEVGGFDDPGGDD